MLSRKSSANNEGQILPDLAFVLNENLEKVFMKHFTFTFVIKTIKLVCFNSIFLREDVYFV